ncbi:MAG: hypothetical protein C0501_13775 [Isosphaera sp.]|nr:hypothetical protein [Isosphaera sp.]
MILTPDSRLPTPDPRRPGYVLLVVLIVIVVLSLAAYRFTDAMTGEFRAAVRTSDAAQSRAAAVSGVYYVADLLADPDRVKTELNSDPTVDNTAAFGERVVRAGDETAREARFRIVSVALLDGGQYEQRAALTDEGGKLNVNALMAQDKTGAVLYAALMQLPGMTEDVADGIVDWVDADETPRPTGAENTYYQALASPYRCKNGPLNSLDELLLVKGVTPQLLYGNDRNRNGVQDPGEGEGAFDRGLADYLTVYGRAVAVDSSGTTLKVYINGPDLKAVATGLAQSGIGEEMTTYILAAKLLGSPTRLDANGNPPAQGKGPPRPTRPASLAELAAAVDARLQTELGGGRAVNSVLDLVNTRMTLPGSGVSKDGKQEPDPVFNCPLNDPGRLAELLPALLDKVATREAVEAVPRLNVNTAPREVLLGLPGLTPADVDAIFGARPGLVAGTPAHATGAWLVTDAKVSPQVFRQLERYVTGTSSVYRVQAVGYLAGGGTASRVEAVIDVNLGAPRVVYFRDLGDLDTPRGFETK